MELDFNTKFAADQEHAFSVSQLNNAIRNHLQNEFSKVCVTGEISDLARPQSGHMYLSLKDEESQIRAVIWRSTAAELPFDLEDGMQVFCEGNIDVYPPRGTYQFIVRRIEPIGIGALQLALIQLQEKLNAEGLFAFETKKNDSSFSQSSGGGNQSYRSRHS